jgi:hypothetical protein
MYPFAVLPVRQHASNLALISSRPTLGAEVTDAEQAFACSAGNIDPQHLGSRLPGQPGQPAQPADADRAAIQDALDWPLPEEGTHIVTSRGDADSFGVAGVMRLRARGVRLTGEILTRVEHIAAGDRQRTNPWPGPRPIQLAALEGPDTPVATVCANWRIPEDERLALVEQFLLTGRIDGQEELLATHRREAQAALEGLELRMAHPLVAVTTGNYLLGPARAYLEAPAGVSTNERHRIGGGPEHRKHSVFRYNDRTLPGMDWAGLLAALHEADPASTQGNRWGGSSSFIGSPQGVASGLTTTQVVEIFIAFLP